MKNEQALGDVEDQRFENMMSAALDKPPQPVIPHDFAARVAAKADLLPKRSAIRRTAYGRRIAFAGLFVLAAALFVLAPRATPDLASGSFLLEIVLLLQLAGLAYWLTRFKPDAY